MSQKIAFITGGNRGLGFQTALELKNAGAKVVIGSRDQAKGEQAVAKLRAAGVDADVLRFDITKPADAKVAFDYFNSKYGQLDILVNNAAIAGGSFPALALNIRLPKFRWSCCARFLIPTFLRRWR